MWYDAGWFGSYAYATSDDGVEWFRPECGIAKQNHIFPGLVPDSSAFFIDPDDPDPTRRYKAFLRQPTRVQREVAPVKKEWRENRGRLSGYVAYSADGIDWSEPTPTYPVGDRSTIFYNPFRRKWVYSIRAYQAEGALKRIRLYRECDDLFAGATWSEDDEVAWSRADRYDLPDPDIGVEAQLYNLDAVGYESILLGLFEIHLGPHNDICARGGFPKITDLKLGFSRDGFHWDRPCRDAFIPSSRIPESWDRGYVQSVGGCCLVTENELSLIHI